MKKLTETGKKLIENPTQTLIELGYNNDYAILDNRYLISKYGNLQTQSYIFNDDGSVDYTWLQVIINGILIANNYKYKKLKQTIDYEYTYDKNYNRIKNVEVKNKYGNQTTTTENGLQTVTNNYGSQSGNVTNKQNAYDNSVDNLAIANTSETSTNSHTDTMTANAKTDTENKSAYEDDFITHEEEYGDLSVRTVAELLEKERQIAYFSLYDEIYKDIIKEIGIYIFE